jgi:hypothetical protein
VSPGRDPYRDVKRTLRREVGFRCPVLGCGSPYLTWHHFDPPWRVEHHHRPEGMIALCREHADKADHGAFTDEQLRELKRTGSARAAEVRGRFDWMRRELLTVVGGNFYYEVPLIFEIGNRWCIWFNRDENHYLLLNFVMPSLSGQPRARIEDNFWLVTTEVDEVICPPSGRLVDVRYSNGDQFRAEFFPVAEPNDLVARYPSSGIEGWIEDVVFPLTVVEVWETAAGTNLEFGPQMSRIGGMSIMGNFMRRIGGAAIHVDAGPQDLERLFPESDDESSA